MRSARRLGFAILFSIVLVTVGTFGGWFDISDLINRVNVATIENDFGGETLIKGTLDSKTVSWTKYYDAELTPTINDQKAYSYTEATDAESYIVQYTLNYMTDESMESVVNFYKNYFGETREDSNSQGDLYVEAEKDGFRLWISIEKETDGTDVMLTATHESVIEE